MADTIYNYDILTDTLNGIVDLNRLTLEIRESVITIAFSYANQSGNSLDLIFKAALSGAEQAVLDGIVAAHTGEPLPNPVSPDGIPYVTLYKKDNAVQIVGRDDAVDYIRATHNWCDKCTWFLQSIKATEVLSNTGDGLTWSSVKTKWIDLTHGRQHREDEWIAKQKLDNPGDPHGYGVVVTVDGVVKTQRAPFMTSGGDYSVNYDTGTITFFSIPSTTPMAMFSYAGGSSFVIEPDDGKVIEIQEASAHMSNDFQWMDTIVMAVEAEDPQNPGQWIDVGNSRYKTIHQFIDESTYMAPVFPAQGGNMRGMSYDMQALPIPYASVRKLISSQKTRLRVYLENDIEWTGSRVTATFKSVSYDET